MQTLSKRDATKPEEAHWPVQSSLLPSFYRKISIIRF